MVEPRAGRVAVILAFGYTVAVSLAWYRVEPVPTLFIPMAVSALPLVATTRRQGTAFRLLAGLLLTLWVALGALSVGPSYLPAVLATFLGCVWAKRSRSDVTDRDS